MMLKGKRAIVTGSTSGIGLGIARRLAKEGCNILLNGFGDAKEIEKLRADLAKEFSIKVGYSGADLSKPADVRGMIATGDKELGGIDILVNNAGIQFTSNIEDFPDEKWDQIIAINLSAVFHGMKAVLPQMKKRGWGRIINIASAHGVVASKQKSAYVAAKHGILGLTKVGGLECAGMGVTVNAICPGWVLTPLVQKQIEDKAKAAGISVKQAEIDLLSEKQPSRQFATPEQLGGLAAFLSSDDAAQITGATYLMDGGWTAQ
ncbi:MAG: 3-hydroxybutyrate dehydrogenase [Alphaproteobacteria bacterium]|nr:3-hydroxybutyrate dehydrogenase [Alphaproteobacteria bacterium]